MSCKSLADRINFPDKNHICYDLNNKKYYILTYLWAQDFQPRICATNCGNHLVSTVLNMIPEVQVFNIFKALCLYLSRWYTFLGRPPSSSNGHTLRVHGISHLTHEQSQQNGRQQPGNRSSSASVSVHQGSNGIYKTMYSSVSNLKE